MQPAEPFPTPLPPRHLAEILGLGDGMALCLVRLADLEAGLESGAFVAAERLTPAELARYAGYRYQKRRLEWLGGRMAAKQAAATLRAGSEPGGWQVESAPDGRPLCRPAHRTGPGPELSISHSHGLAAALAVDGAPCGLDLQRVTDSALRVREKFCHDSEAELLPGIVANPETVPKALTMLWAAKEALRKGLGGQPLTGFLAMQLAGLEWIAESAGVLTLEVADGGRYPVITWWLEDFAVAICAIPQK